MKKIVSLLLAGLLIVSGCTKTDQGAQLYTAGTYEIVTQGFGGDMKVAVTVSTDKIEKVEVLEHTETQGIGTNAIEQLPEIIIEKQSIEVDTVAGSTVSSKALLLAVQDALNQAMGKEVSANAAADGEYSVEVTGFHGPMQVSVVIKDGKISAVNVGDNVETVGIGSKAIDAMPERIIDAQSINVDVLTGASVTSRAILSGVSDALTQAGADLSVYSKAVEVVKSEDKEISAEIVIIGAGGAGLTAAIEALENGATSVVLIEKMDITGGNTRLSGGEYGAPNNWLQEAEGIEDSKEQYFTDIYEGGYERGDKDLIQVIVDNALDSAEWLKNDVGVVYRDKMSWYGGHKVARTLWPVGDGPVYVDTLEDKARSLGAEIYFTTTANELIQDENGRVTGVVATYKDGATYTFKADKGVIMTTGGFSANVEMRESVNTMWPSLDANVPNTNSPAITGDGIVMAQKIGADVVDMDAIQLYPVNNPATGNYYYIDYARLNSTALLVNKEGKRFVNEKGTRDVISLATLEQTDKMVYEIIDAAVVAEQKLYEDYQAEIDKCLKDGVLAIGTLEEVCEHFGVPVEEVKATITHYNEMVDAGTDVDFGRTDNFNKIGEGPYFMFSSVVSVHHTMGGIKIDTDARVLDTEGNPIAGLYAAGEVTGGIHGGNRLGSVAVCDTVVFGRVAAQSALAQK